MRAKDKSILTANNCYEDLNRNFKAVLYNTLKSFQANPLVLNMEPTNIRRFTAANFSNCPLHIAYADQMMLTE